MDTLGRVQSHKALSTLSSIGERILVILSKPQEDVTLFVSSADYNR
jgi:hypothetical protein